MIRVLLVEDHPLIRRLLRRLLETAEDIRVVGEAENGSYSLDLVQALKPDVVVMDIFMPEMDGLRALERLHQLHELRTRVLICSMFATRDLVARALRKGALGYLLKETVAQELVDAVVAVSKGRPYLGAGISG
jgi:DNA-binding NarL/FixJ family response regulator